MNSYDRINIELPHVEMYGEDFSKIGPHLLLVSKFNNRSQTTHSLIYPQILGRFSLFSPSVRVMNLNHRIPSSPYQSRTPNLSKPLVRYHQQDTIISYKQKIKWQSLKFSVKKKNGVFMMNYLKEEPMEVSKKKGTIAGAVALIIGTSIGSGILALPKKTLPAGILPSSISMTICWAFLLVEALLLVEINVKLLRKKKKIGVENEDLAIISIRTMAQETLGEWGGSLATITYVFLGYTSMIAYSSKSGEILYHLINLPESISGIFFTCIFSVLTSLGGTRTTDQVNQWLTVSMIGLLVAIEAFAVAFGGWSGFEGHNGNWEKVPATLPVMIFALVYHDLAPVLCAYLEGDIKRIRASVLLGSIVPLLAILIWEAIALGLSNSSDIVSDPVELLMSVQWGGVPFMVEAFSLMAVGTSIIGTLLGFSKFFEEQLNNNQSFDLAKKSKYFDNVSDWSKGIKVNIKATIIVIAPSLLISTLVPDAFSAATDIAGGYCMTILYGILPPVMLWAMNRKETKQKASAGLGLGLICVGLFASGIVVEQIFQDFSSLHP